MALSNIKPVSDLIELLNLARDVANNSEGKNMGRTMHDNNWAGTNNVLATCASVILFFIAHFTLSDVAAIAAILAASTTAWLNIAKYIEMKRKKNKTP